MPKKKSIEFIPGQKVGRVLVNEVVPSGKGRSVVGVCDCGKPVRIPVSLMCWGVQSCGCLFRDRPEMNRRIKVGQPPQGRYNGLASHHLCEYGIWQKMIRRCYQKKDPGYKNYGGRGIRVYRSWKASFAAFFEDMGERPSVQHTLERIDNSGNYEPSNCRWATRAEQTRNTRRNRWIEFDGRRMILADWAKEIGLKPSLLSNRLKTNSIEKAFTTPKQLPGRKVCRA